MKKLLKIENLAFVLVAGAFALGLSGAKVITDNIEKHEPEEIPTVTLQMLADQDECKPKKAERIYFDIPLSQDIQDTIFAECEKHNIDPALVVALIERESGFNIEAVGDGGRSLGLMQIMFKHHTERMTALNCSDLLEPKQNIIVGVDFLAELIGKYDSIGEALTAYNAGEAGAYKHYFSKGKYTNGFARSIIARTYELGGEL